MRRRRSERGGECLFRAFVCGAVSLSVTQLVILGAASLRGEFTVHTLLHGARRDDGTTALARQAPVPPPPPRRRRGDRLQTAADRESRWRRGSDHVRTQL